MDWDFRGAITLNYYRNLSHPVFGKGAVITDGKWMVTVPVDGYDLIPTADILRDAIARDLIPIDTIIVQGDYADIPADIILSKMDDAKKFKYFQADNVYKHDLKRNIAEIRIRRDPADGYIWYAWDDDGHINTGSIDRPSNPIVPVWVHDRWVQWMITSGMDIMIPDADVIDHVMMMYRISDIILPCGIIATIA